MAVFSIDAEFDAALAASATAVLAVRNLPAVKQAYGLKIASEAIGAAARLLAREIGAGCSAVVRADETIMLTYGCGEEACNGRLKDQLNQIAPCVVVEIEGLRIGLAIDAQLLGSDCSINPFIQKMHPQFPLADSDPAHIRESFKIAQEALDRIAIRGLILVWRPIRRLCDGGGEMFEAVPCCIGEKGRLIYLDDIRNHFEQAGLSFNLDILVALEGLAHLKGCPTARIILPVSWQSLFATGWWISFSALLVSLGVARQITIMIGAEPNFDRTTLPRAVLDQLKAAGVALALERLPINANALRELEVIDPDIVRIEVTSEAISNPIRRKHLENSIGFATLRGSLIMVANNDNCAILPGFSPNLSSFDLVNKLSTPVVGPAIVDNAETSITGGGQDPLHRWRGMVFLGALVMSWGFVLGITSFFI